jgi:hypothetical protein
MGWARSSDGGYMECLQTLRENLLECGLLEDRVVVVVYLTTLFQHLRLYSVDF